MDEAFLRFQHLPEQILQKIDDKSLVNSREVAISWREFVDDREYPWKRFMKVFAEMNEKCNFGRNPFHLACKNGQAGIAEMIMRNSARLNINLNAKDNRGFTGFRLAFNKSQEKVVEIILEYSVKYNIDLSGKNFLGLTAFHWACNNGKKAEMLINKSARLNIDFSILVFFPF